MNVPKEGVAGETTVPQNLSRPLIFSVKEDEGHEGMIRWPKGRKFGVDLDGAFGILAYRSEPVTGLVPSQKLRFRRYPLHIPGEIAQGAYVCSATVRDVAQRALGLEPDTRHRVGQQIVVKLPDQPLILASVRWQGHRMVNVETAKRMPTLGLACAGGW